MGNRGPEFSPSSLPLARIRRGVGSRGTSWGRALAPGAEAEGSGAAAATALLWGCSADRGDPEPSRAAEGH